jgi:DNA polymerase IV
MIFIYQIRKRRKRLLVTQRCIFHIDMDAFFASIEIAKNPQLRGKPVIIGGRPDKRGVVSTCSYEARKYGVRSAMAASEAFRLCPHGIFLEGNYALYREISNQVFNIFYQYTPFVEVVSIDEAYLDMTNQLTDGTSPKNAAANIRQQVFKETQLTCSVGIAANKLVSKIAAAKAKPNGLFEVPPGTEAAFLAPLPIQALPGIGAKTQAILNQEGFKMIADLQALSMEEFIHQHGSWGYHYYHASRGEDNRPVVWEDTLPKSIGAETTFEKDLWELQTIILELEKLIEKAHRRLRAHKMRTRRISLKLRYSSFKTVTRSMTLPTHINDLASLKEYTFAMLHHHYPGNPPLRLVGVSLEQLTDTYWQPTLF